MTQRLTQMVLTAIITTLMLWIKGFISLGQDFAASTAAGNRPPEDLAEGTPMNVSEEVKAKGVLWRLTLELDNMDTPALRWCASDWFCCSCQGSPCVQ